MLTYVQSWKMRSERWPLVLAKGGSLVFLAQLPWSGGDEMPDCNGFRREQEVRKKTVSARVLL